jgi:prepilin-type N-terminal cleavage/methylation domain-containing protein
VRIAVHEAGRAAGFTLVEVMVSLLIIGGIMLSLTQLLEAARISRDTIHNIQETQLAGPAIMDLIERDLRGLSVYDREPGSVLRVRNRIELGLDADSLDFATTTRSLVPVEVAQRMVRSPLNEVGYRLRPSPTDDAFLELYRREGFGVDDEPFEEGRFTFLHDHVKHFDVQVFAEDGPDAEPLESWGDGRTNDSAGLPARIEIHLTLELAPRISREQLTIAPANKRTVTYKRVVRFPEALRQAIQTAPRPVVPVIKPPSELPSATGGAGGAGPGGTPGSGGGPGQGGGTGTTGTKPGKGGQAISDG